MLKLKRRNAVKQVLLWTEYVDLSVQTGDVGVEGLKRSGVIDVQRNLYMNIKVYVVNRPIRTLDRVFCKSEQNFIHVLVGKEMRPGGSENIALCLWFAFWGGIGAQEMSP